jgi:hypothetical protein
MPVPLTKLILLTAIHGRLRLAEEMLLHTARVGASIGGLNLQVVAAISPEDRAILPALGRIGAGVVCVANNPVSRKWQEGLRKAWELHGRDADGVMILGSDDFVTPAYLRQACRILTSGFSAVFGVDQFYSYNALTRELGHWRQIVYHESWPIPVGCGRVFSRALLDRVSWRLWPLDQDKGLDTMCSKRLIALGYPMDLVRLDNFPGAAIVDVKSDTNITPWERVLPFFDRVLPEAAASERLKKLGLGFLAKP